MAAAPRSRRPRPPTKQARYTRDGVLFTFAIIGAAYELTLGGARVSALTFLGGLFASPFVLRIEESRRRAMLEQDDEEGP